MILILHNIRSIYNVGAILRSAEIFGVKRVILSGWTPNWLSGLPHIKEKIERQIHKTALGAEKMLEIEFSDDIFQTIQSLKSENYQILALEQHENAIKLPLAPENRQKIQQNSALILGEEVSGVEKDLLSLADHIFEIPQQGKKESLNVSVATGIALFSLSNALEGSN